MSLFQIYFIIAGTILLARFLYGICTFNRLKLFVNENRKTIDELMEQYSIRYSDLVLYHFSSRSVKYSEYSEEMLSFLIHSSCTAEIAIYVLFALFWVVTIPCVLLCLLFGWLETEFEKFSKSILS
jgi:membrane protein YqaA with SNARE-associated domain